MVLMARAEKRTAEERARLVSEQRSSGMTQKAWCAGHGIRLRAFRDWARLQDRGKSGCARAAGWIGLDQASLGAPLLVGCRPEARPKQRGVLSCRGPERKRDRNALANCAYAPTTRSMKNCPPNRRRSPAERSSVFISAVA